MNLNIKDKQHACIQDMNMTQARVVYQHRLAILQVPIKVDN